MQKTIVVPEAGAELLSWAEESKRTQEMIGWLWAYWTHDFSEVPADIQAQLDFKAKQFTRKTGFTKEKFNGGEVK